MEDIFYQICIILLIFSVEKLENTLKWLVIMYFASHSQSLTSNYAELWDLSCYTKIILCYCKFPI